MNKNNFKLYHTVMALIIVGCDDLTKDYQSNEKYPLAIDNTICDILNNMESITAITFNPDSLTLVDIYDSLIVGDIVEKLELLEEKYDLFVALDVFIYIGEPTAFFNAVRKCCNNNSLFIFSIETQEDEGYSLLKSSRYAHSDNYILDVASNGFTLVDSQNVKLRKEGNNWIDGKIYILKAS